MAQNSKHGIIYRTLRAIVLIVAGAGIIFYVSFRPARNPAWGVTFSIGQAQYLGFDWQRMYLEILDELKPKYLRTMVYWDIVEPAKDQFDFSNFDFIMKEAEKRGVKVILVLGLKQPRWPECHEPAWAAQIQNEKSKSQKLLEYIQAAVTRYKGSEAAYAWQVENEPFFPYGPDCGSIPWELLRKEIATIRSLDSRPVILTDSGEKGAWLPTAWASSFAGSSSSANIFGSTMYREIYHSQKRKYIKYPIPPELYRIKAGMVKVLSGADDFVGIELQAEPWFAETDVHATSWEEQTKHMNPEIFQDYVNYARRVGFAQNYFWGVEWWYWARAQGHPEMWEAAKQIFNSQ